jgi:hypothetical protein
MTNATLELESCVRFERRGVPHVCKYWKMWRLRNRIRYPSLLHQITIFPFYFPWYASIKPCTCPPQSNFLREFASLFKDVQLTPVVIRREARYIIYTFSGPSSNIMVKMALAEVLTQSSSMSFTIIAIVLIAYTIYGAIWRLYYSPLSQFPGPKLAAVTLW